MTGLLSLPPEDTTVTRIKSGNFFLNLRVS